MFVRKDPDTKNENESRNSKSIQNSKVKKSENSKTEKLKKVKEHKTSHSEKLKQKYKLESGKNFEKKGRKSEIKGKNIEANPKITKTYQKVKKYKIVEDVPVQKNIINKKTPTKKSKSQCNYKEEVVDEVTTSFKKISQKKVPKDENNIDNLLNVEVNKLNGEETIFIEEGNSGDNQKKKMYKLVEVILEDDKENQDGNETIVENLEGEESLTEFERTESEEVIEKVKTTQTLKLPKIKKEMFNEPNAFETDNEEESNEDDYLQVSQDENTESIESNEIYLNEESYSSRYEDTHDPSTSQRCKELPEDPNRQGPKKLTLYVIEEMVDGKIKKRVVSEEDGITMCEVGDLLEKHYNSGLQ